jgi:hypothetical protein
MADDRSSDKTTARLAPGDRAMITRVQEETERQLAGRGKFRRTLDTLTR